jgi:hypothetical protein
VIGYKAFEADLTCRGFQFEVGETYSLPIGEKIQLGKKGFHFCQIPAHCHKYYPRKETTRYAKIEAWDSIHTTNNSVASKIKILEELTFKEFTQITGIFTAINRTVYLKNGQLHRDGHLPAIEYKDGGFAHYKKGKRHRIGGPAIKLKNGLEKWYKDDKLHCLVGPAIKLPNGNYFYYVNGRRHNKNGPAVKVSRLFGNKLDYYINGYKYVRYDGCIEVANPEKYVWIQGQPYMRLCYTPDYGYDSDFEY